MIRNSFTRAAFIGTVIAAAFSGASFAQDGTVGGAWKIDSVRFNNGWASVSVARESLAVNHSNGEFIVVDGGNVYLATGMAMSNATKKTDVAAAGGKLTLIGTNARRADFCTFKCQYGQPEQRLTLRFVSLDGAEQLMGEMVAYNNR